MATTRISEGEDFIVEKESRGFGARRTTVFKIDGTTGEVTVNGQPVATGVDAPLYFMSFMSGVDASGGDTDTPCPDSVEGDVIVNWLRLDATGQGGKGSFASRDNVGERFETTVATTGQIKALNGFDTSGFDFIVFLKRTA